MPLWRANGDSHGAVPGGRPRIGWIPERARGKPGVLAPVARLVFGFSLLLFSALSSAGKALAEDGFGPLTWSPDGSRLLAWHRGVVCELPFEKGEPTPRTDTIPEPLALAIDWATGVFALAPPSRPPQIDFYRRGDRQPFAVLGGLRGDARLLAVKDSMLVVAGAGFWDSRTFPDGVLLDSLRWQPDWTPVAIRFTSEGRELLFRDRLIRQDGETTFLPVPGSGEAVAFASDERDAAGEDETGRAVGAEGAGRGPVPGGALLPSFFRLRDSELLLAERDGTERLIGRLSEGESLLGVALSASSRLVLIGLDLGGKTRAESTQPRLEVRRADTGALEKTFRSARFAGMSDREADYEAPLAAAFDASGRYLAIGWRAFGTQVWDTATWDLRAMYAGQRRK